MRKIVGKFLYKNSKSLYKIGLFLIIIFGMALMGVYRELFGFEFMKGKYDLLFFGISTFLLVPEYFFNAKEYEKQYGEFNPRLASYWVFSLFIGLTFVILSFIVR